MRKISFLSSAQCYVTVGVAPKTSNLNISHNFKDILKIKINLSNKYTKEHKKSLILQNLRKNYNFPLYNNWLDSITSQA